MGKWLHLSPLTDTRRDGSVEIPRMDGGIEWKGAFDEVCDQERIRSETFPSNFLEFNGCAERRFAMLEAAAFASRFHAKNLFWSAREKTGEPKL